MAGVEKISYPKTVEEQANYEGAWSLATLSRLKNPEIRRQFFDTLLEVEPEYSREELEQELDRKITELTASTPITFKKGVVPSAGPNSDWREIMPIGYVSRLTGKTPSIKARNIIESHEKGHVARWDYGAKKYGTAEEGYETKYLLSERFNKAFDFSKITFSEEMYDSYRKRHPEQTDISDKEISDAWISHYMDTPMELAERMSQLKNYFGFSGDEKFTKEHLDHARKHYVEDTGHDNQMTQFFQAITPEREGAFIELINSVGI